MSLHLDVGRQSVLEVPGPLGASTQVVHPLSTSLNSRKQESARLRDARLMYGVGFAMRLASEDAMGAEAARLPGLPSSFMIQDTLRGDHEKIEFADTLNASPDVPEPPAISLHERAEMII